MKRSLRVLLAAALVLVGCLPSTAGSVSAHEVVHVGSYHFVIGWRDEPPIVGVMNGLDLNLTQNGAAVSNAHQDLTVNLTKGSVLVSPLLRPVFQSEGDYTFDVIPTEPGVYRVHFAGNLDGTVVDFSVALEEVAPASDVEFPRTVPTPGDLQAQLVTVQGQVTVLLILATLSLLLAIVSTAIAVVLARRLRSRT